MNAKDRALATTVLLEITQEWRCSVSVVDDEVTISSLFGEAHAHHSGATLLEALRKALETAKSYAERFPAYEGEDTPCMSATQDLTKGAKP